MSTCRKEANLKRKHVYQEGSNKCDLCGHTTTHGKRFRAQQKDKRSKAL